MNSSECPRSRSELHNESSMILTMNSWAGCDITSWFTWAPSPRPYQQPVTGPIYRTCSYTEGSTKKKGNTKQAGIGCDGMWTQVAPLFTCGYIHLFVLQNNNERGLRYSLEPLVCFFFFSCFFYILLMYLHSIGDFFEIQPWRRQGEKGE